MSPAAAYSKRRKLLRRVEGYAMLSRREPLMLSARDHAREVFLRSTAAKVAGLIRLLPGVDGSAEYLWDMAGRIDVTRPREVVIPFRFEPRRTGTLRIVCDFPLEHRLAHVMAQQLIKAQVRPARHIFGWSGRGRDRAVNAVASALRFTGQQVLVADVQRCFEHVNVDYIYELDLLPTGLIRNALDYRMLRFRRYGNIPVKRDGSPYGQEEVERTAPRGLLEGPAASDALFAVLLDSLASHLSERVALVSCGDNIVVIAREADEISRAENALVRYMAEHPAGPFFLTIEQPSATDGFEFLGYRLEVTGPGRVEVEQSDGHWIKTMAKLEALSGQWRGTAHSLATEVLQGFPAVSDDYRASIECLAEDELESAYRTGFNRREPTSEVGGGQQFRRPNA